MTFSIIFLLLATSILFSVSGLVVRVQLTIFGNFDFSISAAALVAAEIFCHATTLELNSVYLRLAVACALSFTAASIVMVFWNLFYALYSKRIADPRTSLFVISLGFSLFVSGCVGLIRGPGLRQADLFSSGVKLFGISVGIPTLYMVTVGTALMIIFAMWAKSQAGFGLSLLAQDQRFAEELGVDVRRVVLGGGIIAGLLNGLAGSYLAFSSGSTPQIGLPIFLYGAGAALIFPGPPWLSCVFGGTFLGVLYVLVQLAVSPAWANTLIFSIVSLVVAIRGTSRRRQRVR